MKDYNQGSKDGKLMLDYFDWYFIPVANPDGYEYTHSEKQVIVVCIVKIFCLGCGGGRPERGMLEGGGRHCTVNKCIYSLKLLCTYFYLS